MDIRDCPVKENGRMRLRWHTRLSLTVLLTSLLIAALVLMGPAGCGEDAPAPSEGRITAQELVEPNALAGPGPDDLNWSPQGARLAYTDVQNGSEALLLYDAASGERRVLLDQDGQPDNIDVSSAQWSPQGDAVLLAGDDYLWLLQLESGELSQLVEAGASKTAMMFTPAGTHVSYVQERRNCLRGSVFTCYIRQ